MHESRQNIELKPIGLAQMLDMLLRKDFELIKKLVRAWDSEYTKLTPQETLDLQIVHKQIAEGEIFSDDEIDSGETHGKNKKANRKKLTKRRGRCTNEEKPRRV